MDTPVAMLAPYAAHDDRSRGRRHAEPPPAYRSEFQRDRDRIIHSTAFRRLVYKTQVFVNHEGDLYRTRLTHSLEVSQIARTAARALGLNEHLVEAICLAHDLGHTAFGHAGQDALNECMRDYGGFEHNLQSLRVVDELEEKYAEFRGLNLTFEAREGILKHCSARNARELGDVGKRFLERTQPGLEAQLANLADEIAYNHHDIDDGLRAGLIELDALKTLDCFGGPWEEVHGRYPDLEGRRLISEILRRMIDRVVTDLVETTRAQLAEVSPQDIDDVRGAGRSLAVFSDPMREANLALKHFLHAGVYQHYRVLRMTRKARDVIQTLFGKFFGDIRLMPAEFSAAARKEESARGETGRARIVADYIAGMTDRYAILEHERIVDPRMHT
ncbi:MAG: deoxyguanosinetriphosphate triphosphohydrolase [Gammaproteobacteria bacterium]